MKSPATNPRAESDLGMCVSSHCVHLPVLLSAHVSTLSHELSGGAGRRMGRTLRMVKAVLKIIAPHHSGRDSVDIGGGFNGLHVLEAAA